MSESGTEGVLVSEQIDIIIAQTGDWRSVTLSQLRTTIKNADASIVETIKWKKPSRPLGTPVWEKDGIICIGEVLKNAVRLTFPKGAFIDDPRGLFNTRLDSNSVRAIDVHEGETVNQSALVELIRQGAGLNESKPAKK